MCSDAHRVPIHTSLQSHGSSPKTYSIENIQSTHSSSSATNKTGLMTRQREMNTADCTFMSTEQSFYMSRTCDVVEVVETVEVQAAGLIVTRVGTLPPHTGRTERVCHPHSTVGSGAWLQQRPHIKNCFIKYRHF